jgi:excisionase family DNA binding protein
MSTSTRAPDDDAPEPRYVGVQRLSRTFGVSRSTVYTLLDTGRIRSVRFGHRRLIPIEEEHRFAEELAAQAR